MIALLAPLTCPAATLTYHVLGSDPGPWSAIFSSLGLVSGPPEQAGVIVAPAGTSASQIDSKAILILEGESPLAASLGFRPTSNRVAVRGVEDLRAPKLGVVWEEAADLPIFEIPKQARAFARERWLRAPLMAGFKRGEGAVLWIAAPPGAHGYERFPYLPQTLAELGLDPPFRSRDLWAFFDSSSRLRADLDYLAPKWRAAGIAALQVAAWHYWESDPASDEYLRRLIEACHRNAILVYAWFELPHVSEKFWEQHPEWREKTALLQDAQLDWRKLMNLQNPKAFDAVAQGMRGLLDRFDWDGANLAELYFESLEGADNPARFTPMNSDVRGSFFRARGFDPADLFEKGSPRYRKNNPSGLNQFLDFRAGLAARQQQQWIEEIERVHKSKPHLELALTHVDDRFDSSMREKIGADASQVLPLLGDHDFTFLIEDPATIWNLGPQRYPQIAERYRPLTPRQSKLAIDINVVERYQDVYPTKQQTGMELFELVHQASVAFPRVALYFENSIPKIDWPLLAAAASTVDHVESEGGKLVLHALRGAGVQWSGPALVDGHLWPVANHDIVWVRVGTHTLEPAPNPPPFRLLDFNGELTSASASADSIQFTYRSGGRALATWSVRRGSWKSTEPKPIRSWMAALSFCLAVSTWSASGNPRRCAKIDGAVQPAQVATSQARQRSWIADLSTKEKKACAACIGGWALDGMDVQLYSFVIPALLSVWGLTRAQAGTLSTAALLVSAVGGWLAGWVADRFGRVRTLQLAILWFAVFSFVSGLAQNYGQLFAARALLGLGFGGEWAAGAVLLGETIRPEHRGKALGFMQAGWAVGWAAAALLSGWFFSVFAPALAWRALFFTGIAPALLVFWVRRNVEEPPVYLEAKARLEARGDRPSFLEIFRPGLLRTTVIGGLMGTGAQGGYFAITTWLPSFLRTDRGLSVLDSTGYLAVLIAGAFCGYVVGGLLADRIGRRFTFLVYAVGAGAIAVAYTTIPLDNRAMLFLGFPLGFFASGVFSAMGPFYTEQFPTRVRGVGQGFTYNVGRAFGALFPALVGFLSIRMPLGHAIGLFAGIAYAVMAVAAFLLPETRGKALAV